MHVLVEETILITATAEELNAVHTVLERFWTRLDLVMARPPDDECRFAFVTSVAEIAGNIMRYAYLPEDAPGPLRLRLRGFVDHVEACITDQGRPLTTPLPVPASPTGDPLLLDEHGRGLAIARAYLDLLEYRRTDEEVNEWRLVKHFRPDEHLRGPSQPAA